MKSLTGWRNVFCVVVLTTIPASAASHFSEQLSPYDFAAAGLTKLSSEELKRLNEFVAAQRTLEPRSAVLDGTTGRTEEDQRNARRPKSERDARPSRVLLTPGTAIEYVSVETRLVGSFRGYEPGTVLHLENGQRWKVIDGSFWAPAKHAEKTRKVVIEPGVLGSFFLRIEDGGRPKVKFVGPMH
jgi:hypothetical protein